ncbi:Scr1 family TA system antitoxin-like transcriptional regulator, partial [Amycolatopsis acidiphila]|uniref:Scr1 family TA system antitoxin-like transcriptional regulator n=1 Tax=Amycolatopsis acidiphila TaxID=715473 RepID=UPI001E5D1B2A
MADHRADPSALRFLIGHDLKVARERANLKQTEAAKVLGCSQAKINYLETGKTQQKPDEVTALLRAYDADVEHVDRMASLAARADQGTWWAPFSDVLPNWFKIFVGLEGLAAAEFSYESLLLPGQLQTPDYAAALLVGNLRVPPMDAQQVVRAEQLSRSVDEDLLGCCGLGVV